MKPRRLLSIVVVIALLAGAAYGAWSLFFAPPDAPAWRFAQAERGPIVGAVSATGTLNPVVSVQVGSQISGQIEELFVDFNSPVTAGQLIARLDPETHRHRVRQAEADLEAARASMAVQEAEHQRARVNLIEAQRDAGRKRSLVDRNFLSPAELDKASTLLEAAAAQERAVAAQVRHSAALMRQREAQLAQARVDLSRTEIRAPIDGIVIKRSVQPGQTVAASLQAPELFVIARNLAEMQVETAIGEADVGRLHVGQAASFTVDAFPGRQFQGKVKQVRKAAQVVSNVVSYTVVISADNADLILLPGMTANVRIITAQKDDVLKIANAALRFRPPMPEGQKKSAAAGRGPGHAMRTAGPDIARLYVAGPDGQPQAIEVRTGINDGNQTEIAEVVSGEVREGMAFIVAAPATDRPRTPQPRLF